MQTLAVISRKTGLPAATAYRMVAELVAWDALEPVGRGGYRLGMRLWRLGSLAPSARNLRDIALPYLQDLYEATHQVVHLVVPDGYQALFVERLMARPDVRVQSRVAHRLPLHATGPGKVLLAHSLPEFVEAVIAQGLPKMASNTMTDPEVLRRALEEIRRTGHCVTRDEITEGASSVAAPIFGAGGDVVASCSVVMPSSTPDLHFLVPAVRVAAAAISRALRRYMPEG